MNGYSYSYTRGLQNAEGKPAGGFHHFTADKDVKSLRVMIGWLSESHQCALILIGWSYLACQTSFSQSEKKKATATKPRAAHQAVVFLFFSSARSSVLRYDHRNRVGFLVSVGFYNPVSLNPARAIKHIKIFYLLIEYTSIYSSSIHCSLSNVHS